MYTLNNKALDRLNTAKAKGLEIDYTALGLAQILIEQEVITFQNTESSVLFDIDDVIFID